MQQQELIAHLFRLEFSRITAVLCKHFGLEHIGLAEDIAGETFLAALETWPYKGLPANPTAWLYKVAQNKTLNHLQRDRLFADKILTHLPQGTTSNEPGEIDLSDRNIADSQLQMLFAICHPAIPSEAQIGLALRILCGFGIGEIANAFVSNKETINKRLARAKEKLREQTIRLELPGPQEIIQRTGNVLTTLYLLYNEGYYSESQDSVLREDLCLEAMRLVYLLLENEQTRLPEVNALLSLMCFQASRFKARKNEQGEMVLYEDQDETLWNQELISKGAYYLQQASVGPAVSAYHLEAGIAYWHTIKSSSKEKWENILQLYNRLLQVKYSPIAALNRTYALAMASGKEEAIAAAEQLQLTTNPYYHTLLGELYTGIHQFKATQHFQQALLLATTQADKQAIQKKLDSL